MLNVNACMIEFSRTGGEHSDSEAGSQSCGHVWYVYDGSWMDRTGLF